MSTQRNRTTTILPVSFPFISCYQHHAAGLSIILGNSTGNRYMPWFCDNFIQLRYRKNVNTEIDADFLTPFVDLISPLLTTQNLSRSFIIEWFVDIINFVNSNIFHNRYVYTPINTEYISAYKFKGIHPILIYGYDEKKEILYCADYFDIKFSFTEINYQEFIEAYLHVNKDSYWWEGLKLIEYNKQAETKYFYDKENVINELQNYLNSEESINTYRIDDNFNKVKYSFGIGIYDRLYNDLCGLLSSEIIYDTRILSVLIEHKIAISHVINYVFPEKCYLREEIDELKRICKLIRNLMIKYTFVQEKS